MKPAVLYVDDEQAFRDRVSGALGDDERFDLRTAVPSADTLDALTDQRVDVLVCEYELAGRTGDELLTAIRRRRPLLPVVLFTDRSRAAVFDGGQWPMAYVSKSADDTVEQLRRTLVRIVDRIQGRAEEVPEWTSHEVFQRITDAFYALDEQWRFTYVNDRAERLLDRSAAELRGEVLWEAFPETAGTILEEKYRNARATQQTEEFSFYYAPLDTWFRIVAYPSEDGLSVYFRDVTAELLQTRALDETDVGIVITNPQRPDNPIVYVNEGFEKLTGYAETAALGRNCRFLQGPLTEDEPVAAMREAIAAREPVDVEILNYHSNGTPFWNHVRITPIFDATGQLTRFVGFQHDVTARVERERRAELLDRVLRHNLRNELNVVKGNLESLGGAADREAVEAIDRAATRLLALSEKAREVNTVLSDVTFEPSPRALEALLAPAVEELTAAGGEITADVDADIEVLATDAVPAAFRELLENAVKHSGEPVRVTAERETVAYPTREDERAAAVVRIVDSGPTLSNLDRAALLGEETALRHGTGIGLWLVYWLVTMSGGLITHRERQPRGNVVSVTLLRPE